MLLIHCSEKEIVFCWEDDSMQYNNTGIFREDQSNDQDMTHTELIPNTINASKPITFVLRSTLAPKYEDPSGTY